jgi:hypothetical protein
LDAPPARPQDPLPTFCTVVFIIDLVLISLRGLLVFFGIVGMTMMDDVALADPMLKETALWEVLAGAAMVVTGLAADIMLLSKIQAGIFLAIPKVLATLGTYAVAFWQASFLFARLPDGSPEQLGATIGVGITFVFRLALLALFIVAVVRFHAWSHQRSSARAAQAW